MNKTIKHSFFHPKQLLAAACALAFLLALAPMSVAQQGGFSIGGYVLYANGKVAKNFTYTGSCPVQLKFDWSIVSTEVGESIPVQYAFKRSDGSYTSWKSVTVSSPGTVDVTFPWQLGGGKGQYTGWVQMTLDLMRPAKQKIPFTVNCK
jgi:hypothetical protein